MNKSIYLEKMLNYKAKYFNLNDTEKQMIKKFQMKFVKNKWYIQLYQKIWN